MRNKQSIFLFILLVIVLLSSVVLYGSGMKKTVTDSVKTIEVEDGMGRTVRVPENPRHVICSGAGCLRLLVYLEASDCIVAVDDIEKGRPMFEARPYALANPMFKEYPLFGEFRGHDNPELIASLDPQPEIIFKTFGQMGSNPDEIQKKTGIPVVVLEYGDLFAYRKDLYGSLRLMGRIMGKEERAEEVIAFFNGTIADLDTRTADIPEDRKSTCFVGGIAFKGPHGLQSTEPAYPPFLFTNAKNVAYDPTRPLGELTHADVSKEKIVEWDPEYLFVDLATIQSGEAAGAVYELRNDAVYQTLSSVRRGDVFGVLPYNWYTQNFGSIFADAYYIGTILYPERFADIDPEIKADEIYKFLVGEPVFDEMNELFQNLVFKRIPLER
ncbi:MAG: iron ABC transporter substrate-binding protein [Spirochaetes bacterium]|nr:iron ABC transporter substrate-binding protein [Spirochaetota bacterium]